MTLTTDYAVLITIAKADELHGIREQILDRLAEIGMAPGHRLLCSITARQKELAAENDRLQRAWDAEIAADRDEPYPETTEESQDGW